MPLIPRLASTFRGLAFYVVWTWGPASIIFIAGHWLMAFQHGHAFAELPFLIFASGTFAAGVAAYFGMRVGRSDDAAGRHPRAGISVVLKVFALESASGLLFCLGMAAYGVVPGTLSPNSAAPAAAMLFLMLALLLFLSLLTGLFPCAVGTAFGIMLGAALRRESVLRREGRPAPRGDGNVGLLLSAAGFAALNAGGLLWTRSAGIRILHMAIGGNPPHVTSVRLVLWLLLNMLLELVLLGNLWACLVGFWLFWRGKSDGEASWRTWPVLVPLVGLAAFGVWCVGRFLNA